MLIRKSSVFPETIIISQIHVLVNIKWVMFSKYLEGRGSQVVKIAISYELLLGARRGLNMVS